MPFIWAGCMDGSSIDMNKIDAFVVGQVQQHDSKGQPMFEVAENPDTPKVPILQMCVFCRIGQNDYPVGLVASMHDAQIKIQGLLGTLKSAYDHERGVLKVATAQEKAVLKI